MKKNCSRTHRKKKRWNDSVLSLILLFVVNVISLIVSFFTELQNRGLLLYTYTFLFRLLTNDKRNMVRNISQIFVECNVFSKLQLKTNRMCCFYYSTSVIGDLFFFAYLFLSHFSSIALYRVGTFFLLKKKNEDSSLEFRKKGKKKLHSSASIWSGDALF